MVSTKYFPFLMGLDQTTDDRLLEPGRPRAIENLAIRKKGRLGMRYDYDALGMVVQGGGTLSLFDLVSLNGRLQALGDTNLLGYTPAVPTDIFEYNKSNGAALYDWRPSATANELRLPLAIHPKLIGRLLDRGSSTVDMDVAAGNGLVCAVSKNVDFSTITIHVIDAETDATILYQELSGFALPRVVCTGTKFFIGCTNDTLTTPKLFRFDPAVDTQLTALTDPAAAGGAINSFDMSLSHEGTTFWMAYGRAGPLTRIHGFDANGTETHDFAGPAVLCFFITVFTEATVGAVGRIHLACVINATNAVNMSTYLVATSALQTNTPAMYAGATSQVGMCIEGSVAGQVNVVFQSTLDIMGRNFLNSTHAVAGAGIPFSNSKLNSKLLNIRGRSMFAALVVEAVDGSATHLLVNLQQANSGACFYLTSAVSDRLIAKACNTAELPNLAFDVNAASLKAYWIRAVEASNGAGQQEIYEHEIASTARRQTAQLGDALYLAACLMGVFDGRSFTEAGWLERPVLTTVAEFGGGALTVGGLYQFVAVFETSDSHGNRIQSHPSDVGSFQLTAGNNVITWSVTGTRSLRRLRFVQGGITAQGAFVSLVIYRTQANNITFYRDTVASISPLTAPGLTITGQSIQSDLALGANEVLYTQGARGALSGPLPFLTPEGCSSLAASADRILGGGLPALARIQESRPLFVAEQSNWSDGVGFQRETRGRVLAVQRLDERRIVWTSTELFELDGEGLDDNGIGTLGAPRRLPSDVGLYGGVLGWRSIVECSLGIMFQGLSDQIYLLPRGGSTPTPIGMAVQDRLAAFPVVTSATYMSADQTVRFTCNNVGATDSISLLYDIVQGEWVTEGPYGTPTASSIPYQGRMVLLQNNVVRQQRSQHPPAALIANAWRSGSLHPFGLGAFGLVLSTQFYGEYRGDCLLKCIFTFDDGTTTETILQEVNAITLGVLSNAANAFIVTPTNVTIAQGAPFSAKFTPDQIKCECVRVDFEVDVPFPNVIAAATATDATASNDVAFNMSALRQAGDRVIAILQVSANGAAAATAAGWTQRSSTTTAAGRQTILERILDGSEVSLVTLAWAGTAAAGFCNIWTVRNSHPSAAIEVASVSPNSSTALAANGAPLTPSWGIANTLWLAALAIDERTAAAPAETGGLSVHINPRFFRRGIASTNISATATLSGQLTSGDKADRVASLTPTNSPTCWAYTNPSDARSFTIAIRPNDAIASEGLVYHYWTMDVEDAGKSALKSPLQMG